MAKYLLISNRGSCPRVLLTILGATTKRENFQDPSQGGWFGSGTKYAPVAALALGIEVIITSGDRQGPYRLRYDIVRHETEAGVIDQIVLDYGAGNVVLTPFSTQACMNWVQPIGDDGMKSFRVLREYLRNAKDADPDAPYLSETNLVQDVIRNGTSVHLSLNDEIRHMLSHWPRYFKYLHKCEPVYALKGVGKIYRKSEPKVTRMFSLETLAMCSADSTDKTVFDYSFDDKSLMSEERVFHNMTWVLRALGKMIASIDKVELATALLGQMMAGSALKEKVSLGHVTNAKDIRSKKVWVEAWHRLKGENAVIASSHYADQFALNSFGKKPVEVTSTTLKIFLTKCGVRSSSDIAPDQPEYRLVEPNAEEQARLDFIVPKIKAYFEGTDHLKINVFEPLSDRTSKMLGFIYIENGKSKEDVFIQKKVCVSNRLLVDVLQHEFRHARSGELDATLKFQDWYDKDVTRMLMEICDIPDDLETEDTDLAIELPDIPIIRPTYQDITDFFDDIEFTDIEFVDDDKSTVEKSIDLINKVINGAKPVE